MFKPYLVATAVTGCFSYASLASDTPQFMGETVVVTASRHAMPLSKVLADTTVIDRKEIETSNAQSLPQLLSRQSGISFYSNGGPNTTSGIYLRGTSTKHSLILLDGMNLSSATLGEMALQNIPLDQIERIEIVRGPASSLYGSDAIGGVIQIFTRKQGHYIAAGVGDHGTLKTQAGWSGTLGKYTQYSLNGSLERSDGFSAKRPAYSGYNPDNDGYSKKTYNANVSHTLRPGHTLSLQSYQTWSMTDYDDTDYKNPSYFFNDYTKAKLTGQAVTLKNRFAESWNSTLIFNNTINKLDSYTSYYISKYDTTRKEWLWQNDVSFALGKIVLGLNYNQENINSSVEYPTTERTRKAGFAVYQGEFDQHLLQTSLRHDDDSQFGSKVTGQISYGYRFMEHWLARASYGTAYKAPTFNELYYPEQGNPNLTPESSRNQEIGLKYHQDTYHFNASIFKNTISDMIVWVPQGNNKSKAINIGQATLRGLELEGGMRYLDIDWSANATWMIAEDTRAGRLLDRRPRRQLNLTASKEYGRWISGVEASAASSRVDSEGKANLAGYAITNLFANYRMNKAWTINARLTNVFDRDYQLAYGYNTGRVGGYLGVRYAPPAP